MRYILALLLVAVTLCGTGCSRSLPDAELLTRAETALEEGDFSSAEVDIKTVLQRNGTNAVARELYGRLYLRRLDAGAAIEQFERALASEEAPSTRILLAKALLLAANSAELVSDWEDGLYFRVESDPEFQAVLARALLAQQDYARAREALASAAGAESPYASVTRAVFASTLDKDFDRAQALMEETVAEAPGFSQAWRLLAAIALENGDREAAIAHLGEAVEANPYRISDRVERIRLQIAVGRADEAEADLTRLEKQIPGYPPAEYLRGKVLFDQGNYKDAIDMLSRVLGVVPDHPGALLLSANANTREGNYETAQRQLSRYRSSYPDDTQATLMLASIALQLDDAARAEGLAREILEGDGMNTKAMGVLAAALAAQGQNAESAQYFEQVASQVPESAATLAALGTQEMLAGDEQGGLGRLETAVALEPTNWAARERLIDALLSVERFADATAEAEAYVDAGGGSRALVYLGRTLVRQDRLDDANDAFLEALASSPGDPMVSANLSALSMLRGDTEGARETLESSLEVNPGDLETSLRLAAVQEKEGDFAALEKTLNDAVDANPAAQAPRISLARLKLRDGAPNEAAALLAPLAESESQNPVFLDLLVRAYLAAGELEAAENFSRRLLPLRADDPATQALVGQIYNARGRYEVAEQHIRGAREKFPDDVTLHKQLIESLLFQGKLELATDEVARLPESVQQEVPLVVLRGRLALAERDTATAKRLFEQAFEAAPSNVTLSYLAGVKWVSGERDAAMADLEGWLEEHADDTAILMTVANRNMELGEIGTAGEYYERVVTLQPGNVVALNNLAWILRDRNTARALEYIRRADGLAPRSAQIKDTYAMVELARGNHERALSLNATALELGGNAPEYRYNRARMLVDKGSVGEARELLEELVAGPAFSMQGEAAELLRSL